MSCFCSLFAILGRFWGCLYAIFDRINTKMRVCHKSQPIRPERAKALKLKAFALSGRLYFLPTLPRAMPWARSFWAFSPTSAAII